MSDIVIVGGGVFGLSTAAQYAHSSKVSVIDKFEIPSPISASTDYNKIVRLEYNDEIYAEMAVEAMRFWQGEGSDTLPPGLLTDTYSHCGRISVVPPESSPRYTFEMESLTLLQEKFGRCQDVSEYCNDLTCNGKFSQFRESQAKGKFRYNRDCGIGIAAKSLLVMKQYCKSLGVTFIENDGAACVKSSDDGVVVSLESGAQVNGRKALIACGANTPSLLDLRQNVKSTGLYVGHIQLTEQEFEKYRDIPVVFNPVVGYFFPPDPETRVLKICASASSTYDLASNGLLPRYKKLEPDTVKSIPIQSVVQIRTLLAEYLPDLLYAADGQLREIQDCKICWISDTSDSNFIIDEVPENPNVFVSCGDSGHGYKFLPNIGSYIMARMENNLSSKLAKKWAFRESVWDNMTIPWRIEHKRRHVDQIQWY
ncbi:LANO_0D08812g1_1 [Lachancea nothofagi CBS 11611]|uniref:LANO_0D08812g1_1 n=1 Tax=Lachancea nothofagi CBS 11611 TaxID=1266666 RepID=A0A1G4JJF7_9SACH|nr:LANO_0D08812g1_1 [Lachancea nothofagi CBS 11611]